MEEKTFEVEMLDSGRFKNLLCGLFLYIYIVVSSGAFINASLTEVLRFSVLLAIASLASQFVVVPWMNKIITRDISVQLERAKKEPLSSEESSVLILQLLRCPFKVSLEIIIVFSTMLFFGTIILFSRFVIPIQTCIYIIGVSVVGIFNAALMAFCYAEKVCAGRQSQLIRNGVDARSVLKESIPMFTLKERYICFIGIPFLISNIIQLLYFWMSIEIFKSSRQIYFEMSFIFFANCFITLFIAHYMHKDFDSITKNINSLLENLNYRIDENFYMPVDLTNEFSYGIFLTDMLILKLHSVLKDTADAGNYISESTQTLFHAASESAVTSISEATAVRECIATLENSKLQHERLSKYISAIKALAEETKESARKCSELLQQGIAKMSEITQANLDSIFGIKNLSEKIENIWNLVGTIDIIAERTKIIAFNAELEVSVAGERGEKFHVVANEIRRLAATITDSTREIKQQITGVQHLADTLIIASEGGTQKTREGAEFYTRLEANFEQLCLSSDVTAESITSILGLTLAQKNAFDQINDTLEGLNGGFENFSCGAQDLSSAAETLQNIAKKLGYEAQKIKEGVE